MRLAFQPGTVEFYNHFNPCEIGIQGIGVSVGDIGDIGDISATPPSPQQLTAAAGSIASFIPVAGPFIALAASVAIMIENMFQGCGQSCIQTSSAANQAGAQMEQLVHNYIANPIRTVSMQAAALQTFDRLWSALTQACSNPQYGAAGQRCVTDRQRGACTWKASPGGWNPDGTYTFAGPAGFGDVCWNWFVGYRDPIANDPYVVPDAVVSGPIVDGTTSSANQIIQTSPAGGGNGTQTVDTVLNQSISNIPLPLILGGGALLLFMAVNR